MTKLYSNEIVFRGHPDKVCDQISAAILNECLKQDKHSRVGVETVGGKGKIFITGEITTNAKINVKKIAKRVLKEVGYSSHYKIIDNIGKQSQDIALGTNDKVMGAGDQGMMFGYACNDTEELLPKAQVILQEFAQWYDNERKYCPSFLPDGKAQITGEYNDDFQLIKIKTFLVSYQNTETKYGRIFTDNKIKEEIKQLMKKYNVEVEKILINPTGKFKIGGFEGDAGLTGRKIVVDSYQSFANVGGGCMNGKDPTKVDISAAYKARQLAIRFLKEYDLKWCEVQISYAIGLDKPLAIYVDSNKGDFEIDKTIYEECTPKNIINDLNLLNIDYEKQAQFGHFKNDTFEYRK